MIFKSSLKKQSPHKGKNQLETENKSEELWKVGAVVLSTTFTFMAALYHRFTVYFKGDIVVKLGPWLCG